MMANSRYDTCAESRKPLDERAVPLVIAALTCHIYKAGISVWVSLSRGAHNEHYYENTCRYLVML